MGPYGSTFAAYSVTVLLAGAGIFGLLFYDGVFDQARCGNGCLVWNFIIVQLSTIGFTFVPWSIWRHLQPIEAPPKFAAPVAALVGLALSDIYLIFVSAVGRSEPVSDQLFFMLAAGAIGGICGPIYGWVERYFRRRGQSET